MPEPLRCRHIHTEGRQCGSPALRDQELCYHHHAARRPLAGRPKTDLIRPHLPCPEDLHAVQSGIAELLRLVSMGNEDYKTHKLLLGTLALASANLTRIERHRRQTRTLALALAEARFAARLEARQAQPQAEARLSGCHSQRESASKPTESGAPCLDSETWVSSAIPTAPEPNCPTFHAVSPRLRWDRSADEPLVTDPVHDPILGTIAPGPDPEPRTDSPTPNPTPLLTPAPLMPTKQESLARWNRAVAKLQQTINLDATAADPAPDTRRSPRNPFSLLDRPLKLKKLGQHSRVPGAPPSRQSHRR